MLGFGLPERPSRRHVDVGDRVFGGLLLRVAEVDDGRPVDGQVAYFRGSEDTELTAEAFAG